MGVAAGAFILIVLAYYILSKKMQNQSIKRYKNYNKEQNKSHSQWKYYTKNYMYIM